jgi:hypothetical protein
MKRYLPALLVLACSSRPRPFPLRDPFLVDTDTHPVSIPCRPEPTKDDPHAQNCAPREYVSPFLWDQLDNLLFARVSRVLAVEATGEARNVNSLDEVPDSAWFTNRRPSPPSPDAPGACKPGDMLPGPDEVEPGSWVIDHGKDNGSTPGFRVDIPGKGKYMLKADEEKQPERASAASVIGAAIYHAIGYNTSCEQIVAVKKEQLTLTPGLVVIENSGVSHPFDEAALDEVLHKTTQLGDGVVRFQASKWLPGHAIGPFRYTGTRDDDPNDVIDHADRRELRGGRVLAAWLDHWDAREQNSMDIWLAVDKRHEKSSPGYVKHYILDTSDTLGEEVTLDDMSRRLGHTYEFDATDILDAVVTLGADEEPWDRAHHVAGERKFGYFSAADFDPVRWRPFYPNPAFIRATERDNAWMARKIAQFSPEDVRAFVALGRWSKQADADYVLRILLARQQKILRRYLTRISPIGDIHAEELQICGTDFARLRSVYPQQAFQYTVVERGYGLEAELPAIVGRDGRVCFTPRATHPGDVSDSDDRRRLELTIDNGTTAAPLVVHAYDLGPRGIKIVGLTR